jgi:hypothetical protein
MGLRSGPRILIWMLGGLLIVGAFQTIVTLRRGSHHSSANPATTGEPKGKPNAPVAAVPSLPLCPPAGLSSLESSQKTGDHSVTLTWNASAPSVNPAAKTVGYCLYRSKKKDVARKDPHCRFCERVNSRAIAGTGCVDDLVENGETYYYVVKAINAGKETSLFSNEATAKIPSEKGSGRSDADSYPLCRTPDSSESMPRPAKVN